MIIETREEYLRRIGEQIGESEEDIAFLEDMTDTYDSLYNNYDRDTIQRLTQENDELRRKYRERFFTPAAVGDDPEPDPEPEDKIKTRFEDLFTVKEEK